MARVVVPVVTSDGDVDDVAPGCWVPTGCNSRLRLSKYFPGERFAPHTDHRIAFSPQRATLMTVNIYLNDLSLKQSGRTLFYANAVAEPVDCAGGSAGSLALFKQQCVRHEGAPLASGLKYLLRTDIVCEKLDGEPEAQEVKGEKQSSQLDSSAVAPSGGDTSASHSEPTERDGACGGWWDLDEKANELRGERTASEQALKRQRKEEGMRCSKCRRFACICV